MSGPRHIVISGGGSGVGAEIARRFADAGDRVTISRPGQEGCSNFVVRRTQWDLEFPDDNRSHRAGEIIVGSTNSVTVECTFAVGPYSSEEHKRTAPGAPAPGAR